MNGRSRELHITGCLAVLLFAVMTCMAPLARAEAGWTSQARVIELIPLGRLYYEVRLDVEDNPSGCREEDGFYVNYLAAGSDKMFDLFVDNIRNSLRLRVYVTGVCNLKGYAEISAVSASPNR